MSPGNGSGPAKSPHDGAEEHEHEDDQPGAAGHADSAPPLKRHKPLRPLHDPRQELGWRIGADSPGGEPERH